MISSSQTNFHEYIDLLIGQLTKSEIALLPKELIINSVITDNNNPKESQLSNLLITKLTKSGVDDLERRLLKVKKTYKLNSLIEQIYKNKPKQDELTILSVLQKDQNFFKGKFLQLNDPNGNQSIYSEIIHCKKYQQDKNSVLQFTLENGSYIDLHYQSNQFLAVYTSYKRKVKFLELIQNLKSQNPTNAKIEFFSQREEFMENKVKIEIGTYDLSCSGVKVCATLEKGKQKAEYILKKCEGSILYKFDIRYQKDGSIQHIYFCKQQDDFIDLSVLELNAITCNYFEEKTLLKSLTPSNAVENIQIKEMKIDENKEKLKKLEEIGQCKDNILKFFKEEKNQSLLDSLLNNLVLNNFEAIKEKIVSSIVTENMNKIQRLNQELDLQESQESILKNTVLEAIYTNLIQKSKTLQVLKVMDLLKQSFHHTKSVNQMDLIIFLGGTGAGKSTSINYYLSNELEEYEKYGRKFLKLKEEKDLNPEQYAKIGHSVAVSETTFIQGYKVEDMDKLMLCDCPGFDDTRGDIYDLTTMLSIDQTIKNCNSIKAIVLTLSYETFFVNRSRAVVQLFENLQQLIPCIYSENQVKNSIFILITKANNPNDISDNLEMLMQDVYKTDNKILNQLEENQNNQQNLEKIKVQERLQIWKFVLYLIQNKKVISYNIANLMEAEEQLKAFKGTTSIDKSFFCKAMDRSDIQIAFSKYILLQIDTWRLHIFEKYLNDIPNQVKEAEAWIDSKKNSIQEKIKENLQNQELISTKKIEIQELQTQIKTLNELLKSTNQEKIIEQLKKNNTFSNKILKDTEEDIQNHRLELSKKKKMLEGIQSKIDAHKKEIQTIQVQIKQCDDEVAKLSEGNTTKNLYEYRQYGKDEEMHLIYSDNMQEQLEEAFNKVSDFQAKGTESKVKAGEYSGELIHLVYIEEDYYVVPKAGTQLIEMQNKEFTQDGKKYKATIQGENWKFDLGMKAQPDRKKMVYSIVTTWRKGATIPWFKISHDLPNMEINEATIVNTIAKKDALNFTIQRKSEDIKEFEKEINDIKNQIKLKEQEICQNEMKIQEVKKQQGLKHIKDQIISIEEIVKNSQLEIKQVYDYIELNKISIISEEDHINQKNIELLNLQKQSLHYAIIIKCKIEIAHLLQEFAKISINGLGIDQKNIDCNLIPQLQSYSEYYENNIENIMIKCEETFRNFKQQQHKQSI